MSDELVTSSPLLISIPPVSTKESRPPKRWPFVRQRLSPYPLMNSSGRILEPFMF
ncbi:hypothetical protein [Rhizobium leguminosarum]|uniref:hypothetical protein n=1 Tax=Rhizobium leguminosarum TaxID=384 RepID=UPI003D03107D